MRHDRHRRRRARHLFAWAQLHLPLTARAHRRIDVVHMVGCLTMWLRGMRPSARQLPILRRMDETIAEVPHAP